MRIEREGGGGFTKGGFRSISPFFPLKPPGLANTRQHVAGTKHPLMPTQSSVLVRKGGGGALFTIRTCSKSCR